MPENLEKEKTRAATEAVKLLRDGQIVGLGTGSTAQYALRAIAERVSDGLKIQGIPTSEATRRLAGSLGIPLLTIEQVEAIDLTIDGADEFTADRMLLKGGGGALVREKIVATMSRQEIIIADSSKLVEKLGKFGLPIAVVPFAWPFVQRQIYRLKGIASLRMTGTQPFVTDDGQYILDADFGLIDAPAELAGQLDALEGVVAHGLFLGLAGEVFMGRGDTVKRY